MSADCPIFKKFCIMPPDKNVGDTSITNFNPLSKAYNSPLYSQVPYSFSSTGPSAEGLKCLMDDVETICSSITDDGWQFLDFFGPSHVFDDEYAVYSSVNEAPKYTGFSKYIMNKTPGSEESINLGCGNINNIGCRVMCSFPQKFNSNPITCCLNNMYCTKNNHKYLGYFAGVFDPNCFNEDADGSITTCDFAYRRLGDNGLCYNDISKSCGSSSCYGQMSQWCTMSDPSYSGNPLPANINMPQKWSDNYYSFFDVYEDGSPKIYPTPCLKFMFETIYSDITQGKDDPDISPNECPPGNILEYISGGSVPPIQNPKQFTNAKKVFTTAVKNYLAAGGKLDALPSDIGSNQEFNQTIYTVCDLFPEMCTEILQDFCGDKTVEDLSRNPATASFCGCYLNPLLYQDILGKFGINRECSPYCVSDGVLQISDGTFTGKKMCNQSVCMIDNVSIDMINARIDGAINISNLCGNCQTTTIGATSGSNCECILDNINVDIVNSSVDTLNLQQSCKSTSCYKTIKGSTTKIAVDCSTGKVIETETEKAEKRAQLIHNLKIIGLILLFIFLLIVFFFFIGPSNIIPRIKKVFYPPSEPAVEIRSYRSILDRK